MLFLRLDHVFSSSATHSLMFAPSKKKKPETPVYVCVLHCISKCVFVCTRSQRNRFFRCCCCRATINCTCTVQCALTYTMFIPKQLCNCIFEQSFFPRKVQQFGSVQFRFEFSSCICLFVCCSASLSLFLNLNCRQKFHLAFKIGCVTDFQCAFFSIHSPIYLCRYCNFSPFIFWFCSVEFHVCYCSCNCAWNDTKWPLTVCVCI